MKKKKVISIILAGCLAAAAPVTCFAEEAANGTNPVKVIADSGTGSQEKAAENVTVEVQNVTNDDVAAVAAKANDASAAVTVNNVSIEDKVNEVTYSPYDQKLYVKGVEAAAQAGDKESTARVTVNGNVTASVTGEAANPEQNSLCHRKWRR